MSPIPPPLQSQRRRAELPSVLTAMAKWTREEFLQSETLRADLARLLDGQLGSWAQLFAALEPVPSEIWRQAASDEALARDSWLAGYRICRRLHGQWDRESAWADRLRGGALHPRLWRVPEWANHGDEWIAAAADTDPLKAHKRGVVSRVEFPASLAALPGSATTRMAACDPAALIVKHFPPHKKVDPRNSMGLSKAIGSLHACEALNRRGLRAAVGYAAWSKPKQGSWMLLEDLAGFDALQHVIVELHGDARAALLAKLARYARRMHLLGVAYRDFKPSNILVNYRAADDMEIAVIDHDRNWFRRTEIVPSRARRDLAALHAGLPNEVRATERLQALRIYGEAWGEHRCDWGYRGPLWEQQIPKLFAEAIRRNRLWKPIGLLGA